MRGGGVPVGFWGVDGHMQLLMCTPASACSIFLLTLSRRCYGPPFEVERLNAALLPVCCCRAASRSFARARADGTCN